ncbi:MAG TPA: PAS domain-containing protein, partial [Labilithrix sp.]|nr:PAS domain-containing protein [Labilithrix sp.]
MGPNVQVPRQIAAPLELWVVDVEKGFVGAAPPEALAAAVTALARRVAASGEPEEEVSNLAADASGRSPVVRLLAKPAGGCTVAVASLALDGLRDAEDELTRYDMVMRATHDSISDWNATSGRTWWNQRAYEMLGSDPESTTPSYEAWASRIHPEDRDGILQNCEAVVFRGNGTEWQSEYRLLGARDVERVVLDRGYVQRDASGQLLRAVSVMSDITGERKATAALKESEERFREMTSAINQVFWVITHDHTKTLYLSPAFETIWGLSRDDLYQDPNNFFLTIHEEDRARVAAKGASAGYGGYNEVFRIRRPDGTIAWIHDRAFPVHNAEGELVRIVGVATDITALRDLEQQLAQAQRMESIGRLAGGIAHDFNNLLTVILASARMVTAKLPDDSELQVEFDAIRDAGERAARLTSQLLAFARRQVIAPTELDLTDLARHTENLLRRVIGEHIELVTLLTASPGVVIADRAQLEQVLVNLAINARDAMPNGGRLTIETRRVTVGPTESDRPAEPPPGNYVALSVSDTGPGIPSDAVPHVFEPFFTTKPAGEGTGLGLATCYGIIKQASGVILVDTVVGTGTTFTIMLPEVEGNAAPIERRRSATNGKGTGTETI